MARSPAGNDEDARLLAQGRDGDNTAPYSVSEISSLLKRTVEDRFGHVRLRGELSGVKRAASGHLYCSLKDEKAVIDAVMWRGNAGRLSFLPEDGVEVVATGKLTTYPGRSKYQIVVETMEIAGEGALLALLEKLKARLQAEGLFAPERKRPLPFLPRVIGVVTSPTGAVIRDILHRLEDRFPCHVIVWPVLVQGDGAARQVAAAVEGFSALSPGGPVPRPDVVIVARGGGSIEDLWSFNEEPVVRAIAASSIPVISAVGHETDTTLSDFAADLRAPTPTAAAELVVPVRGELAAMLIELGLRQRRGVARPLALARERLVTRAERMPDPRRITAERGQRLDDLADRLRLALSSRASRARAELADAGAPLRPALLLRRCEDAGRGLDQWRHRLASGLGQSTRIARRDLEGIARRLTPQRVERGLAESRKALVRVPDAQAIIVRRHSTASERLAALSSLLRQLDPYAPLDRGYAVVEANGKAITSQRAASAEPRLTLKFRDGSLDVSPLGGRKRREMAKPSNPRDGSGQQSLF